jgi:hypothetical protein
MTQLIKTFGGIRGEIISQDEEKTVLRLPVTRFSGPDSKDLHGEYFRRDCYFGDDTITTKFGLYEHLMNPQSNPYAPEDIEAQVLGPAKLAKTDDMARWFDFEIKRANQYHDYVLKLNDLGYLGTSTQCFPNGKRKTEDGGIDRWLESEVTITPTPADSQLVPKVVELAKSFNLPEPVLVIKSEPVAPTQSPSAEAPVQETPASTDPAADPAPVAVEEVDVEAAMNALVNPEKPVEETTAAAPEQPVVLNELKSLREEFSRFKAWVWGDISISGMPQEGETLSDVLRAIQVMVGNTNTQTQKTQKALLALGDHIVKKLGAHITDLSLESEDERNARKLAGGTGQFRRKSSSIPDHAPGD